jgi:regulator of sigma D
MGNELILKLLKSNNSLKNITELFIKYLDFIKEKKINKESIDEIDNILAAQSLYGLLQLKLYKEDDLIIILKNKRCLHKIKDPKFIN